MLSSPKSLPKRGKHWRKPIGFGNPGSHQRSSVSLHLSWKDASEDRSRNWKTALAIGFNIPNYECIAVQKCRHLKYFKFYFVTTDSGVRHLFNRTIWLKYPNYTTVHATQVVKHSNSWLDQAKKKKKIHLGNLFVSQIVMAVQNECNSCWYAKRWNLK